MRAGGRALPAVLMVALAIVASARAAETLGPVGRSVASEVAAVRLLSDAIVRAVRTLADEPDHAPAALPDRVVDVGALPPACLARPSRPEAPAAWRQELGWHRLSRPPPVA